MAGPPETRGGPDKREIVGPYVKEVESFMLANRLTKTLMALGLAAAVLLVLFLPAGAFAAPSESGIEALFPLTEYDKAVLDGLDVEADLLSGAVEVVYDESEIKVTLKQAEDRLVFYMGTDFSLAEPSSTPTGTLVITNETGESYRLADYFYAARFKALPRVFNSAARKALGSPLATDKQKYDFLNALDDAGWWALNKAEYFSSGESYDDLGHLNQVINDVSLYGEYDSIEESSDDMIGLAAFYYMHMIRVTFNQTGYPVAPVMAVTEKEDINLYSYLYKTGANRARMLNSFFPAEIGPAGLTADMVYAFDGPGIGNGYQGVTLENAFVFVLEKVEEEEVTTPPTTAPVTTEPSKTDPTDVTVPPTTEPGGSPPTGELFPMTAIYMFLASLLLLLPVLLISRRRAKGRN